MSLKAKYNGEVGLSIYDVLLVLNSNQVFFSLRLRLIATWKFPSYSPYFWPTQPPLRDMLFQKMYGFEFDRSRSFIVKYNGEVGFNIYDFLLMVTIWLSLPTYFL